MAAFDDVLDAYELEHRHGIAAQTLKEKRRLLLDLCEHVGTEDLAAITRADIVGFMDHLAVHGRIHRLPDGRVTKRKTKAGAKSRKTYLSGISAFFDWCVQTERVKANPCDSIKAPRVLRRQGRAFTFDEVSKIIAAVGGETGLYFRTLYISGIRASALRTMPTFAFMLTADEPRIELPPKPGKQGNGYTAALDDETARQLRELLASRGHEHRTSEPLFNVPGPTRMRERLVRACKKAGVAVEDAKGRRVGLHCFRRANVTRIQDLGFDAKVAQLQAGHADVSTTLRNYTDRGIPDQIAAVNALAGAIRPVSPPDTGHVVCANKSKKVVDSPATIRQDRPATSPMTPRHNRSLGTIEPSRKGTSLSIPREGSVPSDLQTPVRRGEKASMSKWAILDSNQYPPSPDMPHRLAGVIHHALRVAERWSDRFGRTGSPEPLDDQGNSSDVPGRSA